MGGNWVSLLRRTLP